MRFAYPATVEPQPEGTLLVRFTDVPEALTEADDQSSLMAEALDCLAAALEGYVLEHRPLPEASPAQPGQPVVVLPPLMAAKAALYTAMHQAGISNSELARRLDTVETTVRRMLDLRHRSHIGPIERALALLGRRLVVSLDDAA